MQIFTPLPPSAATAPVWIIAIRLLVILVACSQSFSPPTVRRRCDKTRTATCKRARGIASKVARRLLHNRKVPAKIGGFNVVVKRPCKTCAPDSRVTATSGKRKITFHVLGGA
jgi:hypothetical protein